jgi:hypothetical protein
VLTDNLHTRKICAKLVPKNLSVEQKANRLEVCRDLLGRLQFEPEVLDKLTTEDESWVFDYDPETKQQNCGMAHENFYSSEESTREQIQGENYDLLFFFDSRGIVHKEFVPPGQAAHHAFYKDFLE